MVGGSLTAALAVATAAFAIESESSNWDLRPQVTEARELIGVAHQQARALDAHLARGAGMSTSATAASGRGLDTGGSYEYNELKRTATRFSELGNEILDKASHCGEDSRKVALNFRKRTQRFASSVRSVATGSADFARMAVSRLDGDIDGIEQALQGVASLPGCSKDSGDDGEEEAEKSG
jgi:hypothetical protein